MANPEYLFAIQAETGHEVVSWKTTDVDKVSEVTAELRTDEHEKIARILHRGEPVAYANAGGYVGELTLMRWTADDKLADPVKHPVVLVD